MAHDLDFTEAGAARMAFIERQDPWHRLGTAVAQDDATLDNMMNASQTGFTVTARQVIATDANGEPLRNASGEWVYVNNSRATVAQEFYGIDDNGEEVYDYRGLATVGTRYVTVNNRTVAERAQSIVAASDGDAAWSTMGALDEGRRFFGVLELGRLILDVRGTEDVLERYLAILHSHDGTMPVTFLPTNIRVVCANTAALALRGAKRKFTARHTANGMAFTDEEARKVLNISADFAEAFTHAADELIRIDADEAFLRKVIAEVWPVDDDASRTIKENANEREVSILGLFGNDRNAGGFGGNGWTAVQSIGEYLDHYRDDDRDAMALTSLSPDSWVTTKKLEAHQAVLALA